jgi:hypothetical protein
VKRGELNPAQAWAILLAIVTVVLILVAIWIAPGPNVAARLGYTATLTGFAAFLVTLIGIQL